MTMTKLFEKMDGKNSIFVVKSKKIKSIKETILQNLVRKNDSSEIEQ